MTADEALRRMLAVLLLAATGYPAGQNLCGAGPAGLLSCPPPRPP